MLVFVPVRRFRPVLEVAARRRVDDAVDSGDIRIDPRVFRVAVVDRVAERRGGRDRIGAHPHQVARIEVRADDFAHRVAQPVQRRDVVHILMPVQFEAELADALVLRIGDKILPERDQRLIPLPLEDFANLRRPFGRDPVRVPVARRAGASRHHHDAVDAHHAGQPDRLPGDLGVAASVFAGMQRIARAVEGADRDPVIGDPGLEITARGVAVEHSVELDVRRRRPVAAREFEHVHFHPCRIRQHRVDTVVGQAVGDHSNLDDDSFLRGMGVRRRAGRNPSTGPGIYSLGHRRQRSR